jgi:hypothetical protein
MVKVTDDILIKKIAFDVFKVDNDPYNGLWTTKDVDGEPYLVRMSSPDYEYSSSGDWTAASDYDRENITLSYKEAPIMRFSADEYGFTRDDIITFKSAVLDRTSTDEEFIKSILLEQTDAKRSALLVTFPELKKYL